LLRNTATRTTGDSTTLQTCIGRTVASAMGSGLRTAMASGSNRPKMKSSMQVANMTTT